MSAFEEAYSQEGTGTLYWCGLEAEPNIPIAKLLKTGSEAGRTCYYVPMLGFDDVMVRLGLFCSEVSKREEIKSLLESLAGNDGTARAPFSIPSYATAGVIKSNAFELECA